MSITSSKDRNKTQMDSTNQHYIKEILLQIYYLYTNVNAFRKGFKIIKQYN